MVRAIVTATAACLVTAPLAAGEDRSLTADHAQLVRETCGFPQTDIIDASAFDSFDQLDAALADRGVPQIVYGGAFKGADFTGMAPRLARTCFHTVDLAESTWEGVRISGLVFVRANMSGAKMAGADLPAVRFEGADLSGADLSGAGLKGGRWVGATWSSKLKETNFDGARLVDFTFTCGIVMSDSCGNQEAVFTGVDFTGADLTDLPIWGYDSFAAARLDRTVLAPRALAYLDEDVEFAGPVYLYHAAGEDPAQRQVEEFSPAEVAEIRGNILDWKANDRPSFDCARAASGAERLICGEWAVTLRDADRLLAEIYAQALEQGLTTRTDQRAWLASRNKCEDDDCLHQAYRQRSEVLLGALGPVQDFLPGEQRYYSEEVLALAPEFRSTPLYRRLVDPLRAATHQEVVLTMRGDGSIGARGSAVGGNGHLCDFTVENARFDPASGWYSAVTQDRAQVPLFRLIGNELEFRYSGNLGDTPDEAGAYISCGARAGFSTLVDLTR